MTFKSIILIPSCELKKIPVNVTDRALAGMVNIAF